MKRLVAIVEGRVQDVGYREFVRRQAQQLKVTGWVRNRDDGAVEVVAEGEDVALAHLLVLLEKGTPLSRVDDVHATYSTPTGELADFHVC